MDKLLISHMAEYCSVLDGSRLGTMLARLGLQQIELRKEVRLLVERRNICLLSMHPLWLFEE